MESLEALHSVLTVGHHLFTEKGTGVIVTSSNNPGAYSTLNTSSYLTWLLAAAPIDRFRGPNETNDLQGGQQGSDTT